MEALDSMTGLATIFLGVMIGLCALLLLERVLTLFRTNRLRDHTDDPRQVACKSTEPY